MDTAEPSMILDILKFLNLGNTSDSHLGDMGRMYFNFTLLRMLSEELNVDVTINANGGAVKAHKSVLMSVSPVFEAMFKHSMQEQLSSTVDLPDISIKGLELFLVLVYILNDYTAAPQEFEKSINEHFDELFEACCKYQVWRVEPTIIANLKFHLTPDNCWHFLHRITALPSSSKVAEKECWSYIWSHPKAVSESESFISEMQTNPYNVQKFVRRLFPTTPRVRAKNLSKYFPYLKY